LQEFALQRPSDINLNIALSDKSDYATFYEIVDTGLSTFSEQIANSHIEAGFEARSMTVQTASLSNVLEQFSPNAIHFLKIDVEGAEKLVLAGLDLQKFRPWIILVEATKPLSGEPNHQDWESDLLSRGYDFVYFDGLNRFYVSHDHPELRRPLALPPNIFDNFVQIEQLDEVSRLQAQLAALKNSTSWRLTSPFREGKLFLQALRTHLRFIGADLALRFRSRSTASSKPAGLGKLPKHVGGLAPSS
jgi:FkbM family methyltransferase